MSDAMYPVTADEPAGDIPDDLIKLATAAREFSVPYATLHHWTRTGALRSWDRGPHSVVVSRKEVEAILQPRLRVPVLANPDGARTDAQRKRADQAAADRVNAVPMLRVPKKTG